MEQFKSNDLNVIISLLSQASQNNYIGENITQLEHALQCAYFAQTSNADDEMIIAALFHDIGHLCASPESDKMLNLGILNHEKIGAQFLLQRGFSQKVAILIEGHVNAKRFLVSKNHSYYENLSQASRETLTFQGGVMTEKERLQFENEPFFKDILKIRAWDESAKKVDFLVPGLEHYKNILYKHLAI